MLLILHYSKKKKKNGVISQVYLIIRIYTLNLIINSIIKTLKLRSHT